MKKQVISYEKKCIQSVFNSVFDMMDLLKEDDIFLDFSNEDIHILLQEFYKLYESKQIIYSYQEDIQTYFATIFNDVFNFSLDILSFDDIVNGFLNCYYMMSPVELEHKDFIKTMTKVYHRKGGNLGER